MHNYHIIMSDAFLLWGLFSVCQLGQSWSKMILIYGHSFIFRLIQWYEKFVPNKVTFKREAGGVKQRWGHIRWLNRNNVKWLTDSKFSNFYLIIRCVIQSFLNKVSFYSWFASQDFLTQLVSQAEEKRSELFAPYVVSSEFIHLMFIETLIKNFWMLELYKLIWLNSRNFIV